MDPETLVKSYIKRAFVGVTLGDGVDIHTAEVHDSYGYDEKERRLAAKCERKNWTSVDPQLLRDRAWVLAFLDAKGLRFYLPVMMIDIIDNEQLSDLRETLFYNLKVDRFGRVKDQHYADVFDRQQQAAIIRFLRFLLFNRGWDRDDDAGKLLDRLNELRKQSAKRNNVSDSHPRRH